jgi:hypothetical protein
LSPRSEALRNLAKKLVIVVEVKIRNCSRCLVVVRNARRLGPYDPQILRSPNLPTQLIDTERIEESFKVRKPICSPIPLPAEHYRQLGSENRGDWIQETLLLIMGRELQKKKNRSSVAKSRPKDSKRTKTGRRKVDFAGNEIIAKHW